jgi:hypothetical protein
LTVSFVLLYSSQNVSEAVVLSDISSTVDIDETAEQHFARAALAGEAFSPTSKWTELFQQIIVNPG